MTTLLTKLTFIKALSLVKEHEAIMEEIKAPLQKLGDFPLSLDIDSLHRQALLLVLKEVFHDESDWIGWWLWEDVEKIVEWEEDGQRCSADLTDPGNLYDFLMDNITVRDDDEELHDD